MALILMTLGKLENRSGGCKRSGDEHFVGCGIDRPACHHRPWAGDPDQ